MKSCFLIILGFSFGSLGMCVKMQQKSTSRLHNNWASPVSRDPGIAILGSQFTGPAWLAGPTKDVRAKIQLALGCLS